MELPGDEHEGWDALLAAVLGGGADDVEETPEDEWAVAATDDDVATAADEDVAATTDDDDEPVAAEDPDADVERLVPTRGEGDPHLVLDLNAFEVTEDAPTRSAAHN